MSKSEKNFLRKNKNNSVKILTYQDAVKPHILRDYVFFYCTIDQIYKFLHINIIPII